MNNVPKIISRAVNCARCRLPFRVASEQAPRLCPYCERMAGK